MFNIFYICFIFTMNSLFGITTPKNERFSNNFWNKMNSQNIGKTYGNPGWVKKIKQNKDSYSRDSQLEFNIPILLGKYADVTNTYFDSNDFQNLLFGNNSSGSLKDYYSEISYGNFILDGQASGWYQSSLTQSQAVENVKQYVAEIAAEADPNIDYGQYDNDGPDNIPNSGDDDGYVDGIAVVYPGCLNGDNNIWAHQSSLSSSQYVTNDLTPDGQYIIVDTYLVCPELPGSQTCITSEICPMGLYAHEFGHILGLPDLYDRDASDGDSEGVGEWCLMASGNWLGYYGDTPAHMSSWCKIEMGWMEPTVIMNSIVDLPIISLATSASAIKIFEDDYHSNRYFLIENRQKIGFDTDLNGSGLLIYHVDENRGYGSNGWSFGSVNDNENTKMIDVESADGFFDLDDNNNRGDDGDPFPGSSNNLTFNNLSNPSSNRNDGFQTDITIQNITESDSIIYADFIPRSNSGYNIIYDENGIAPTSISIGTNEQWSGVVFTSDRAGYITEVDFGVVYESFWNVDILNWEVNIYDSFNGQNPGNLVENVSGSSSIGGWETVQIDSVQVGANQEFFVSIKFINDGYVYAFDNTGDFSGRSYFSSDGVSYSNQLSNYGDANIRPKISTEVFNSLDDQTLILPEIITLFPNYPNPFNPSTKISFYLSNDAEVILDIYDLNGRRIDSLIDSKLSAGNHSIKWLANQLPSGIYFSVLRSKTKTLTEKMILVK